MKFIIKLLIKILIALKLYGLVGGELDKYLEDETTSLVEETTALEA